MEQSTIKISKKIKKELKKQMNYSRETYESIIVRLLKFSQQDDILTKEVIKNIEQGVADIKAGRIYTTEQLNKELDM